jgi:hypothetical protein
MYCGLQFQFCRAHLSLVKYSALLLVRFFNISENYFPVYSSDLFISPSNHQINLYIPNLKNILSYSKDVDKVIQDTIKETTCIMKFIGI